MDDMPLNPKTFADALEALGTTNDVADARRRHAAAFRTYMNDLVTAPPLTPANHDAAEAAMEAALVNQEQPAPIGLTAVNLGYFTYASTLIASFGGSWVPAVPPIAPGPLPAAPAIGLGASAYALQVHNWVTKISGNLPTLPPVPWS